jgi:hypothetical protein
MTAVFSIFRVVAFATAGWFLAILLAAGLVFGLLGDTAAFWVNTLLMGALAFLSGPLLAHSVRSAPRGTRERGEWTGEELFYAIVFFISLFVFLNSVAYFAASV